MRNGACDEHRRAMDQLPITPAWRAAVDDWARTLRAAGRTAQTIETRCEHIRRMSRQTGVGSPALVRSAHLIEWAAAHEWSRETRRSIYASLRRFFSWALSTGLTDEDPTTGLPSVKPAPAIPRPAPERVYAAALAGANPRARMIVRLAAEAGLRRAEIARVARDDLFEDLDGWSLRVEGKGERVRIVPLSDSLAGTLRTFIGRRIWAFPSSTGDHLTPRHVGKIAGSVLPDPWTLHTLRHRFATVAHEETRDLIAVQRLLGHASVATTQRYVATDRRRLRAAVMAASSVA